mmetsp:Transcript_103743/g.302795  ORF Transcript_103743/g.302795 Transcript_103743/m.302795 type:complete len:221 (+) Transcript_103743:938-1600(+)
MLLVLQLCAVQALWKLPRASSPSPPSVALWARSCSLQSWMLPGFTAAMSLFNLCCQVFPRVQHQRLPRPSCAHLRKLRCMGKTWTLLSWTPMRSSWLVLMFWLMHAQASSSPRRHFGRRGTSFCSSYCKQLRTSEGGSPCSRLSVQRAACVMPRQCSMHAQRKPFVSTMPCWTLALIATKTRLQSRSWQKPSQQIWQMLLPTTQSSRSTCSGDTSRVLVG